MLPHYKVLEALDNLGLSKHVRECYRHSIYGEFSYQLYNFLSNETSAVVKVGETHMNLDFSNPGLEKDLFLHGIREKESTKIFGEELEKSMTVIDIGSNIGYYTFIAAEKVGESGKIKAFEPDYENFNTLMKNIELNRYNNIECVNKAAGAHKKKATIKQAYAPNRNRILEEGEDGQHINVEPLDNLATNIDPDMIRMDVEGYELEIMKGMEEVLETESLKLFLELHSQKIEKFYSGSIDDIWEKLSEKDFKIKYLIRHPPKAKLRYFFQRQHAPREVLNPDMPIDQALEEFSDFFEWESTFRIFLEKN